MDELMGLASIFLWEWFTTKPYVDSGEVRFIGSVYSQCSPHLSPIVLFSQSETASNKKVAPWPCWSIAATTSTPSSLLQTFLSSLEPYVTHFNSPQAREREDVDFVVDTFGHQREDVVEWLGTVRWEEGLGVIEREVVEKTLRCVLPLSFDILMS